MQYTYIFIHYTYISIQYIYLFLVQQECKRLTSIIVGAVYSNRSAT